MKRGLKRAKGFSLLELMIVIVIVAMLAAISAPSIMRSIESGRVSDLNRALANGLSEARGYAMRTGQVVLVRLDRDADGDYMIVYTPMNFVSDPSNTAALEGAPMSCALAIDGLTVPSPPPPPLPELFTVRFRAHAPDQELLDVSEPNQTLCFSPSGRAFNAQGLVLNSGCGDMNYFFAVGKPGSATEDCPSFGDVDARVLRQLDDIYYIHVSATGQVRVMQ